MILRNFDFNSVVDFFKKISHSIHEEQDAEIHTVMIVVDQKGMVQIISNLDKQRRLHLFYSIIEEELKDSKKYHKLKHLLQETYNKNT